MVDSGIMLLKYWLEVGPEEQTRRLESRIDDPRKIWKLSDMDLQVLQPLVRLLPRPGRHVRGHRHRLGALVHRATPTTRSGAGSTSSATCSSQVPYEPLPTDDVTLPERQEAGDYRRPNRTPRLIPTPF